MMTPLSDTDSQLRVLRATCFVYSLAHCHLPQHLYPSQRHTPSLPSLSCRPMARWCPFSHTLPPWDSVKQSAAQITGEI